MAQKRPVGSKIVVQGVVAGMQSANTAGVGRSLTINVAERPGELAFRADDTTLEDIDELQAAAGQGRRVRVTVELLDE